MQEFAASLDVSELKTIVTELLVRDQGAFEDYCLGYRPRDPPRQPQPGDQPTWCRCGNCRPMPSAQENKCCWQTGSSKCAVDGPNFFTVISPAVLDIAMAHYNDFFVHDQERNNAAYRHQAYRQFTLQRFGRLGQGNRRVVPSCVVLAIRRRYPDPTGIYTGYKEM
ncbi:P2X purinoceptor 7-like [Haliotis asinina]|uniref:P2X purinoceptor 7-like n=1 Tax=Haliotis asinina TaxID=109174 RepID=UPI0035317F81